MLDDISIVVRAICRFLPYLNLNVETAYTAKQKGPGPPRGFWGPVANLQYEAPCVCDRSKQRGQTLRESGGFESRGTLRTFLAAPFGRFLEYIQRG